MAPRGPRSRGFRTCRQGSRLCAVLALVTPAAAGAPAPDLPDWLAARLRATVAWPAGDTPAWVARYEYRGGTVFYFPPRCCGIQGKLYDAAGNLLCRPDSGFVDSDERCPDFLTGRWGTVAHGSAWLASRGRAA